MPSRSARSRACTSDGSIRSSFVIVVSNGTSTSRRQIASSLLCTRGRWFVISATAAWFANVK